jgi:hypothetical protein
MYDAKDFYFDAAELSDKTRMRAVLRSLVPLLKNTKGVEMVAERIKVHAEFVESQLADAVGGVLNVEACRETRIDSKQIGNE